MTDYTMKQKTNPGKCHTPPRLYIVVKRKEQSTTDVREYVKQDYSALTTRRNERNMITLTKVWSEKLTV